MSDTPCPEPDLDAILRLMDPAIFATAETWKRAHPPWSAHRDVAVVALCWLVGLRPLQIEHLKRSAWRPRGRDVVRAPGVGRYEGVRDRDLPVLTAARDAVDAYLGACPFPVAEAGPLVLRDDGAGFAERDVSAFNARLKRITGGRLRTLADLSGRFRRYIEHTGATDGTVERLVGRTGVHDHLDPGPKALRRALEAVHPVGEASPIRL
jgi:integrase